MEIDRIYFYVVDATRIRDLFVDQMGLKALGEQVDEHTIEYLVGNAHLSFSISSPLNLSSPIADYLQLHPSGVKGVSFRVLNLDRIREKIDQLGIKILAASSDLDRDRWIEIQGWGAIEHTIIEGSAESIGSKETDLTIDHIVLNVPMGELESATNWYRDLFDFHVEQTFDIHTQKSGLTSKALISSCGKVRFNINQPSGDSSQIQEFLDLNRGAGIQHIALQTNDIFSNVDRMQQQQIAFLPIPPTYYIQSQIRAKTNRHQHLTNDEWQNLAKLQILADWSKSNPEAILLQIFTQPIFESPTFFFEFIERRNQAKGFGEGNFQALFEAVEQYNDLK